MADIAEIQRDITELQKFEAESTRSRVKDILAVQIRKLQTDLKRHEAELRGASSSSDALSEKGTVSLPRTPVYTEIIKNYAWDQSDNFLKLYVTLKGIHSLSKDHVSCEFADQSLKLYVRGLEDRNWELHIAKLSEKIVPSESIFKVKTDMVLLMAKKRESGKKWTYVTEQEKKAKEPKKPSLDEKEDPSAGIMKLLKDMYDDGDDEMKRSIQKAMYESQSKQSKGDFGI
ncbi:hypothetical protein C0Q70_18259 [Pomacea canaliculata]|uniref:Calcyclin-binding protein n=1 Tax=Pomacea canaliculata TaxID=400727 RepID=A0A2T7NMR6_POMCA|nr:calcyclin-binding protein-like [Pomacea canaliculata]PVD22446.1 hypothetical protein C0Q70_18259 [Pomacea canaliculata]